MTLNNIATNKTHKIEINHYIRALKNTTNGDLNNFYKIKVYKFVKDNKASRGYLYNFKGVIEIAQENFKQFLNAFDNDLINFKLHYFYNVE